MTIDYKYGFDGMTRDRMREKMQQGWKSSETPCGRGSELGMTVKIRKWLPGAIKDYGIESLNDAGAGDLNWILEMDCITDIEYRAFDLVPRDPRVNEFDVTAGVLPRADAILCRHVLNHLSAALALQATDRFVESGSCWLFLTNCENQQAYWAAYGMRLKPAQAIWDDATKWWVELHNLQEGIWETRPSGS